MDALLPAGCASHAQLVLRLLYVFVSVCVYSSAIITCAKLRHSITMTLQLATSAMEVCGLSRPRYVMLD